jgi:hypothetical protein
MLAGALLAVMFAAQAAAGQEPGLAGAWRVRADQVVDPAAAVDSTVGSGQLKGGESSREWYLIPKGSWKGEVERVELRQQLIELLAMTNSIEFALAPGEVKFYSGEITRILYLDREHTREDRRGERLKSRASLKDNQLVVVSEWPDGMRVTESYTLLPGGAELLATLKWESKHLVKPFELARRYQRASP